MANDERKERPIHIQGTANIGPLASDSEATGVKIERVIGNVEIHGQPAAPLSLRYLIALNVLTFLGAILVNIATSQLPESWKPYLWLAWPLVLVVLVASVVAPGEYSLLCQYFVNHWHAICTYQQVAL